MTESAAANHVLNQSQRHTHAGRSKSPVPRRIWIETHRRNKTPERGMLSQKANHDGRKKRAKIYAHVEDRKTCVTPLVLFRIELADHRADVWLQQACAAGD